MDVLGACDRRCLKNAAIVQCDVNDSSRHTTVEAIYFYAKTYFTVRNRGNAIWKKAGGKCNEEQGYT